MKAEKCVNQCGLTGAVRSKQSNCSASQFPIQIFKNRTGTETYGEIIKRDNAGRVSLRLKIIDCCDAGSHSIV